MKRLFLAIIAVVVIAVMPLFQGTASAQTAEQQAVLKVARSVNDYFMDKYADPTEPTNVKKVRPSSLWTRAVYYEGLMALYTIDADSRYIDYTDRWAAFHKWTPRNGIDTRDADDQCCEQTYIERFIMTGDSAMIRATIANIRGQIADGGRGTKGAKAGENSSYPKYSAWDWIDAIQMAMPIYAYLYKITGEREYLEEGMNMYRWSRNECGGALFNTAEGLWWRDADYVPPYKEKDGANCYWSRGNGWVLAALVRVMDCLEKKDAEYKELKKDFVAMCEALAKCQREDGFWNASLMSPVTYGGKETTGTALFVYGMCYGMRNGILKEKTYLPIVEKAWQAMVKDAVHDDGFLGWVQGTGKDPSAGQPVTYDKVPDFDDYGVGCFLLAATEYYKYLGK